MYLTEAQIWFFIGCGVVLSAWSLTTLSTRLFLIEWFLYFLLGPKPDVSEEIDDWTRSFAQPEDAPKDEFWLSLSKEGREAAMSVIRWRARWLPILRGIILHPRMPRTAVARFNAAETLLVGVYTGIGGVKPGKFLNEIVLQILAWSLEDAEIRNVIRQEVIDLIGSRPRGEQREDAE